MGWTDAELSVLLTDDLEIHELNRDYRGVDGPTDVLSFPLQEVLLEERGPLEALGDVVISLETAQRQAEQATHRERLGMGGAWTLEHETLFLLVHGVLHLVGHDHAAPEEEARMRSEERRLFARVMGSKRRQPDFSED